MLKIEIIKYNLVRNVMYGIFHFNEKWILKQKQLDPSAPSLMWINSQYWCRSLVLRTRSLYFFLFFLNFGKPYVSLLPLCSLFCLITGFQSMKSLGFQGFWQNAWVDKSIFFFLISNLFINENTTSSIPLTLVLKIRQKLGINVTVLIDWIPEILYNFPN